MNTDGSGYRLLRDFTDEDGGDPMGLVVAGGTLYGIWNAGNGAVYQINTDGTEYHVLKEFAGSDGRSPGAVVLSGTALYGMTGNGGCFDEGVLYSLSLLPGLPQIQIQPEDQVVYFGQDLNLWVVAGGIPEPGYQWYFNGLALDAATNSWLEASNLQAAQAGLYTVVVSNSYGSVTSLVATVTVEDPFFANLPNNQFAPAGQAATFTCDAGGTQPLSFQWFKGGARLSNGGNVSGALTPSLILSEVFGSDAGQYSVVISNANGTLQSAPAMLIVQDPFISRQPLTEVVSLGQLAEFSVAARGTAMSCQWLKDGVPLSDGGNISGAQTPTLTLSHAAATDAGGYSIVLSNSYDVVHSTVAELVVNPAQPGGYLVLHNFTGDEGRCPWGGLAFSGNILYGTTRYGAGYDSSYGTVFKLNTDGRAFGVLYSFAGIDGCNPAGELVAAGGLLYGTTEVGGAYTDPGTVFKLSADGNGFSSLKEFNGVEGRWPNSGLVLSGTTLYGTTSLGGSAGSGTVFKINTDGSGFVVLHNFTGYPSDGYGPNGRLILSGTTLYGVTLKGGSSGPPSGWPDAGYGTLFRIEIDGSGYRILKQFDGVQGAGPRGGLALAGTALYGTTEYSSGSPVNYGYGTVFTINTDGTGYRVMHTFGGPPSDGAYPYSGLILSGSILYGTTYAGGHYDYTPGGPNGEGTVFAIRTDAGGYTVLKEFAGADGSMPGGALVSDGTTLYGTTSAGGISNNGVVFSLSVLPVVSINPPSQTVELAGTIRLQALPRLAPDVTYRWRCGDSPLDPSCTNSTLRLGGLQFSNAGLYTVVTSNMFGVSTSLPAVIAIVAPVERRPVPALNLFGDPGALLTLDYADALGPVPNWKLLDTVTLAATPQFYFDTSTPTPHRFYRARQTGAPALNPTLDLRLVPAITLTGNLGDSVRVDCINAIGPTDAWTPLATVTLTNTSQFYFDTSSLGQPRRLYRLVPVP